MLSSDRSVLARRSMRFYRDQTYVNLELVVVSQGTGAYADELREHARALRIHNIRVVAADTDLTIGALRNRALDEARGDLVCQWDDDDCYHPDRITTQYRQLERSGSAACYLTDHLHLIEHRRQVFWLDWRTPKEPRDREYRIFPPSALMRCDERLRYPEHGPVASVGEDLAMAARLYETVPVTTVTAMGWLYLYVFHGANVMPERHHKGLAALRPGMNELVRSRAHEIATALRYFGVDRPVEVCGSDGVLFSVG